MVYKYILAKMKFSMSTMCPNYYDQYFEGGLPLHLTARPSRQT